MEENSKFGKAVEAVAIVLFSLIAVALIIFILGLVAYGCTWVWEKV